MTNFSRRTRIVLAVAVMALGVGVTVAFATLPVTDVDPSTVPLGTLAGKSSVYVQSTDAFEEVIHKHGATSVLQHIHGAPNSSTGWHTHPGPNIVLVVSGSTTLVDEHCKETTYGPGQGFATGLGVHEAIAGPDGVDVYTFYVLPTNADVLRTDVNPPVCLNK